MTHQALVLERWNLSISRLAIQFALDMEADGQTWKIGNQMADSAANEYLRILAQLLKY